jgi:hypothetical protein
MPIDAPARNRPNLLIRFGLALFAGVLAGALAAYTEVLTGPPGSDYRVVWSAGRAVLDRVDPYGVAASGLVPVLADRFFYPLPAALFGMPFAWLPVSLAAVCFAAASGALFMFAMTGDGFERVPVVLSIPFIFASKISQTTPLIVGLALIPALSGLALLKPNLGIPLFSRAPRLGPIIVCGVLLLATWALFPTWPLHWLETVRSSTVHRAPMLTSIGAVGLLAATRWRRPEGRLLLLMTVIPHGAAFYDELPLWLVATTRREAMFLTFASWVGCLFWLALGDGRFMRSAPWSTAFLYVPATAIVLRRPNVGSIPEWLERLVSGWPRRLRGETHATPA